MTVIATLITSLGLESSKFTSGLNEAQKALRKTQKQFAEIGASVTRIGVGLSAAVTAPLVGAGLAAVKMAGDFEAAMGAVGIAVGGSADQMRSMKDLALDLGQSTTFSASQAAAAMEELGKQGVSVDNILGGAARAAVNLAAATGSELAPAATAISDVLNQFHLSAAQLPKVVDQITGAVNESKLGFEDFQQAIGQAGGVASSLGVSFTDFNAVLAGTSSQFTSGSDAGTSFKTFLTRLNPASKAAAAAMQHYGLAFYDANGKMKPMADIAQQLQEKLGGLSDKAKNAALSTIFGNDAMRTATGLMQLGARGVEQYTARIAKMNAARQAAARMQGLNGQLDQLKGTLETLAIRLADTGILQSVTTLVTKVADLLGKLTAMSPAAAQWTVGLAAVAAAIGPIMMVVGPLISGIGTLVGWWGSLTAAAAAAEVGIGAFVGAALVPLLPIIAAVAGAVALVYAAWQHWDTISPMLSGLWSTITDTFGPPLTALFGGLKQVMMDLWNGPFGQFLTEAGQRLAWLYSIGEPIVAKLVKAFWDFSVALSQALGPTVKGVLTGIGQIILTVFRGIGDVINIVASLLRGDFSGAWHYAGKLVTDVAGGLRGAAQAMAAGVLDSVSRLVAGVRDWIGQKLTAAMNLALAPIRAVAAAFKWLDDVVVRHSYIPDMVDTIGEQMRRLDAELVAPTTKATSAAEKAFRELAQRIQPLLDRLFPDEAKFNELKQQLADLDAFAKKMKWSPDQLAEARRRLLHDGQADPAPAIQDDVDPTPAWARGSVQQQAEDAAKAVVDNWERIGAANDNLRTSFQDTVDTVAGAIRGLADNIKSHDWLGALQGVLDVVIKLGQSGLFGSSFKARVTTPDIKIDNFGGGRATGGPVLPNMTYLVGERGPELLRMGGAGGSIVPNHQLGSGAIRLVVAAEEGALFRPVVRSEAAGVSVQAVGANNRAMATRGRQRLA